MERRHRSRDREHHGTATVSRDCCRRQSATAPRVNEDYQAYKEDRLISKSERVPKNLPQETEAAQLSGNNDYVQRWLVQTDEEANQKMSDSRVARQKAPSQYPFPAALFGVVSADVSRCSSDLVEPGKHIEIGLKYPTGEGALTVARSRKKSSRGSAATATQRIRFQDREPGTGTMFRPPPKEAKKRSICIWDVDILCFVKAKARDF
jgi:hypothetical protein